MVIMIFMIVSIPIAFVSPSTGEVREEPYFLLFWGAIGGICAIIVYSSYKSRKERQKENAKRRSKK